MTCYMYIRCTLYYLYYDVKYACDEHYIEYALHMHTDTHTQPVSPSFIPAHTRTYTRIDQICLCSYMHTHSWKANKQDRHTCEWIKRYEYRNIGSNMSSHVLFLESKHTTPSWKANTQHLPGKQTHKTHTPWHAADAAVAVLLSDGSALVGSAVVGCGAGQRPRSATHRAPEVCLRHAFV